MKTISIGNDNALARKFRNVMAETKDPVKNDNNGTAAKQPKKAGKVAEPAKEETAEAKEEKAEAEKKD